MFALCLCVVDDAVTVTAILALLDRDDLTTANAIIAQVLADVGKMVPDSMTGVAAIATARMPADNFQIQNLGGDRWRMTVEINAAANPADNTASPVMYGEMAIQMNDGMGFQEQFPNAVLVSEFVESFSCINCLPRTFAFLALVRAFCVAAFSSLSSRILRRASTVPASYVCAPWR